jgi:hypothetical protein
MKKLQVMILVAGMVLATILLESSRSAHSYILSKVKVECISQCDFTGSDQIYVTIPVSSINSKTSSTRSFKTGDVKAYTEIGVNSGSASTAWFVSLGDKVQLFEKDLIDPDDLISDIKLTTANCNGQPQVVTGTNGSGKYRISFTVLLI